MNELSLSEKQRYNRHLILSDVGEAGQLLIKKARVLVVGAGGLGCPVIQYLTATGTGYLTIADNDLVDLSNLQRQVFYGIPDLGKHKAIIAAAKMRQTNSHVKINQLVRRVDQTNARELAAEHDIVVDCTDNLKARYVLNDACVLEGKPLVHASVFKTQGQLSVFNYQDGPSYRCLFPDPDSAGNEEKETLGIYSILPGILGLMQANEVVKIILNKPGVMCGQLLMYDALGGEINFLGFDKNPDNFVRENIIKNF